MNNLKDKVSVGFTVLAVLLLTLVPAKSGLAATQTWTFLEAGVTNGDNNGGPAPEARLFQGASAVYDSTNNRMVIFGGRSSTNETLNDAWVLTGANGLAGTPMWTNLTENGATGSPLARAGQSAVYDSVDNRMIIFGGCNGYCAPALDDVWVLTNANGLGGTPAWVQLFPTGTAPAPRTRQTAVYDSTNNRMIVFAGQDGGGFGCSTYADLWVLTNANGLGGTPVWIQISSSGGFPAGQYGVSSTYDSVNNIMTVFAGGGVVGGSCTDTNAVWTLSNANGLGGTPTWANVVRNGAAGSPPKRSFHTAVYDPGSDRMTIFGGNNTLYLSDTWVLENANGIGGSPGWIKLTPSGAGKLPLARNAHVAIYDPTTNQMTIYSGGNADAAFGVGICVLSDANGL